MTDTLGVNLPTDGPKIQKAAKVPNAAATRRILLEESESIPPTGLFVGVNGRGFLIRPGEPVDVPLSVIEVLDHAVMSTPQMDPSTQQVTGYRERMRYPYRVLNT